MCVYYSGQCYDQLFMNLVSHCLNLQCLLFVENCDRFFLKLEHKLKLREKNLGQNLLNWPRKLAHSTILVCLMLFFVFFATIEKRKKGVKESHRNFLNQELSTTKTEPLSIICLTRQAVCC